MKSKELLAEVEDFLPKQETELNRAILAAIGLIAEKADGDVNFEVTRFSERPVFGKTAIKNTLIEIKIVKSI